MSKGDIIMTCELNLQDRTFRGHGTEATWAVTNKQGAIFHMCDQCVAIYRKDNPNWNKRGLAFYRFGLRHVQPTPNFIVR